MTTILFNLQPSRISRRRTWLTVLRESWISPSRPLSPITLFLFAKKTSVVSKPRDWRRTSRGRMGDQINWASGIVCRTHRKSIVIKLALHYNVGIPALNRYTVQNYCTLENISTAFETVLKSVNIKKGSDTSANLFALDLEFPFAANATSAKHVKLKQSRCTSEKDSKLKTSIRNVCKRR